MKATKKCNNIPYKQAKYKEDWRKEKPGLHLLYTKMAVKHLNLLFGMLIQLGDCANLNMVDPILALQREFKKLVTSNAAYGDAFEILLSVNKKMRNYYTVKQHGI